MIKLALLFFSTVFTFSAFADDAQKNAYWSNSIWENPERGFFWSPPEKTKDPEVKPVNTHKATEDIVKELSSIRDIRTLRERVDAIRDEAIMTGQPEDIKTYLVAQQFIENKAAYFTDNYKRVLWTNPNLDYEQRFTTNNAGVKFQESQKKKSMEKGNAGLAQTHGLIFIFRSDCPVCHEMAPMIKFFKDKTGIEVLAISADGGGIPGFSNPRRDNGLLKRLNLQGVPAYMLVSKDTKEIQPVGFGYLSQADLEERIYTLMNMPVGSMY